MKFEIKPPVLSLTLQMRVYRTRVNTEVRVHQTESSTTTATVYQTSAITTVMSYTTVSFNCAINVYFLTYDTRIIVEVGDKILEFDFESTP